MLKASGIVYLVIGSLLVLLGLYELLNIFAQVLNFPNAPYGYLNIKPWILTGFFFVPLCMILSIAPIASGILALKRKIWIATFVLALFSVPSSIFLFMGLFSNLSQIVSPRHDGIGMVSVILSLLGVAIGLAVAILLVVFIGKSKKNF